jgi:hypothetical protein
MLFALTKGETMKHSIVAKLKGNSYHSVNFVIEDTKKLGEILSLMNDLMVLDDRYTQVVEGESELVHYETGPLSISIETNVLVASKEEMDKFIAEESERAAKNGPEEVA